MNKPAAVKILYGFIAAALLSFSGCGDKEPPRTEAVVRPVKSVVVSQAVEKVSRVFPGTVRASQQADLSFKVRGPLVKLPGFEGTEFKKGQLLAKIDPRDFEKNVKAAAGALDKARAQLKAMKSGSRTEDIRILEAAVAEAKAKLVEADAKFRRYQALYKKGAISRNTLDSITSSRESARAAYRTAKENLTKGKTGARVEDVEAAEAQIKTLEANLGQARDALKDSEMRAPFDGLVTQRFVDNFQQVQVNQKIFTFADLSQIDIEVDIPESYATEFKGPEYVTAVAVLPSAPNKKFPLKMKGYSAQPDPQTRTYEGVLTMTVPPGLRVLPGMTVQVETTYRPPSGKGPAETPIPVEAVFADPDGGQGRFVWLVDPKTMTVKRTPVDVGQMEGSRILVAKGLKKGDRVVTAGVHYLKEGTKVSLLKETN